MTETPQIPLPLRYQRPALQPFLSGACNRMAELTVRAWPKWSAPIVYLQGPSASGKTHLAMLWAELAGAAIVSAASLGGAWMNLLPTAGHAVVEGLDALDDEEALFHLTNELIGRGGNLLLTARVPPGGLPLALSDLKTRIRSATVAAIGAPDEAFLGAFILTLAERAQLAIDPALAAFCVERMERTQESAVNLMAALDRRSLAEGRAVRRETVLAALKDLAGAA